VYAGWYERPTGPRLRAAVSVGRRPTFYEGAEHSLVEAYLLDADLDLYGERAKVSFAAHLRGQQRFDSVADLVEEMKRDVARTAEALGDPPDA
jgi:riboflavin kinase/FMN adenylyltransferase